MCFFSIKKKKQKKPIGSLIKLMFLELTPCLFHDNTFFEIAEKWEKRERGKKPSPGDLQLSQLESISCHQGNSVVFDSALLYSAAPRVHLVLHFQAWCDSGCVSLWGVLTACFSKLSVLRFFNQHPANNYLKLEINKASKTDGTCLSLISLYC